MFLMIMTAFAYDSPYREPPSDLVFDLMFGGLISIAVAFWFLAVAVFTDGRVRKIVALLGGLILLGGILAVVYGFGTVFMGLDS